MAEKDSKNSTIFCRNNIFLSVDDYCLQVLKVMATHQFLDQGEGFYHAKAITCYMIPCSLRTSQSDVDDYGDQCDLCCIFPE